MLQRVQTIFLLLVIIFMGLSFFFPLWTAVDEDGTVVYQLMNLKLMDYASGSAKTEVFIPYCFVATLAAACITITIISISKFTNRLLQMKLGALNAMLMTGTMGLSVYFATDLIKAVATTGGGQYGIGLFAPGAAMICNIIANRFIRKDERLVRSVDRIR